LHLALESLSKSGEPVRLRRPQAEKELHLCHGVAQSNALFEAAGDEPFRMPLPRPIGTLSVENLVAAAPGGGRPILKGVSVALGAGETLGVVGPSAAGKSSLARVLVVGGVNG
jgi:ABC-type protease/lipase transport system fused ATPase/permease subunit